MTKNSLDVGRIVKKKRIPSKNEVIEMFPYGLVQGLSHVKPIFLLADKDEKDFLPVWVDMLELESLAHYFQDGMGSSRVHPYQTHLEILLELGWKVEKLVLKKLDGFRLYGDLVLKCGEEKKIFYKRAEDIILLALYSGAKIFVPTSIIEQAKEVKDLEHLKVIDTELQNYKDTQKYLM